MHELAVSLHERGARLHMMRNYIKSKSCGRLDDAEDGNVNDNENADVDDDDDELMKLTLLADVTKMPLAMMLCRCSLSL